MNLVALILLAALRLFVAAVILGLAGAQPTDRHYPRWFSGFGFGFGGSTQGPNWAVYFASLAMVTGEAAKWGGRAQDLNGFNGQNSFQTKVLDEYYSSY